MNRWPKLRLKHVLIIFLAFLAVGLWLVDWPSPGSPDHADPDSVVKRLTEIETRLPIPKPQTGDLEAMIERRLVRILVPYNKMLYFHDRGQERGIVHDAGMELEKWLNRKYGSKTLPMNGWCGSGPRRRISGSTCS